jgi:hypothetical protein
VVLFLSGQTLHRLLHPFSHHEEGGTAAVEPQISVHDLVQTEYFAPNSGHYAGRIVGVSHSGQDVGIAIEVEGVGKRDCILTQGRYASLKKDFETDCRDGLIGHYVVVPEEVALSKDFSPSRADLYAICLLSEKPAKVAK